ARVRMLSRLQHTLTVFFFSSRRRHTSSKRDWSSDVCSSDLRRSACCREPGRNVRARPCATAAGLAATRATVSANRGANAAITARSEERRVGKEGRSRWWTDKQRRTSNKRKQRGKEVDRSNVA